jgi:hypothetical protein
VTSERRKTRTRIDGDGVKVVETGGVRRGVWLLAIALLLVGMAGGLALRIALRDTAPESQPVEAQAMAAQRTELPPIRVVTAPLRARPVRRSAAPAPPPPPAEAELPSEPPALPEFPDEPAEGPSGVALYPPLGTDPLKRGILVPEDFELPEGYVRHHQATDHGEGLPAILMFHPDYEWLDESGNPIPLPEDGIVPPELAPPGMPIELLELPPDPGESEPVP